MFRFSRPAFQRGTHRIPLSAWFAGSYALFIGLILPFICWGALADPGHPHAGPHFVFTPPPVYGDAQPGAESDSQRQALLASYCGDAGVSRAFSAWLAALEETVEEDDAGPVGQSLPDSLISLIMLAAAGFLLYTFVLVISTQRLTATPHGAGHLLPVPTPPPRFG
ncbi:MAG: hypothetical protein H6642_11985 [Caldilineaceae bacterium]|nr:hypothetical protein [Caldilineaceae bacterium]